jgi:hypothetical protein
VGDPLEREALKNFDYTKPQLQVARRRVLPWLADAYKRWEIVLRPD